MTTVNLAVNVGVPLSAGALQTGEAWRYGRGERTSTEDEYGGRVRSTPSGIVRYSRLERVRLVRYSRLERVRLVRYSFVRLLNPR